MHMAIIDKINIRGSQYDLRDNDAQAAIAPLYSTSATYAVGDYVMHDGAYYVCKTAIATPESWTAGHWMQTNVGAEAGGLKSAINDIHDVVYPNENAVISTTTPTVQANVNAYYDISLLKVGNSYRIVLAISNAIHLANVRTSRTESGSGNVDLITENFDGDSWASGKEVIYTPAVDGIRYLQIQFNSGYVTGEATISIVIYDYTKETTTAIEELSKVDASLKSDISAITPDIYIEDPYNLLPPYGYTVGKLIQPSGNIINYQGNVLSDYITIDPAQGYICNWAKTASVVYGDALLTGNINPFDRMNFCFFDENKNVVPFTGATTTPSKRIPENARYIRVTIASLELYPYARLIYGNYETQPIVRICDYHKRNTDFYAESNTGFETFKMVMFGDSITHGSLSVGDNGISYVDYANDYLHSNIINVGFGGTRMTYPTIEGVSLFCFRNLIDCIVSDNANAWDALDAYASSDNTSYLPHLNKLKAVEWDKIHAIGLMYGANDFTSNTPVGSAYNEDVLNYDGACASALKKLLTKYPHLQVILFGPFDRMLNTSDPQTMTDTTPNSRGLYMSDYANSLENVVSKFHCPLIKTGELFGINAQTILTYAPDGTHPRANVAQKRLGWLFAQAVKNNIAPF